MEGQPSIKKHRRPRPHLLVYSAGTKPAFINSSKQKGKEENYKIAKATVRTLSLKCRVTVGRCPSSKRESNGR